MPHLKLMPFDWSTNKNWRFEPWLSIYLDTFYNLEDGTYLIGSWSLKGLYFEITWVGTRVVSTGLQIYIFISLITGASFIEMKSELLLAGWSMAPDHSFLVDLLPYNSVLGGGGNVKISRSICSDEENLKKSIKWYKLIYFLSV